MIYIIHGFLRNPVQPPAGTPDFLKGKLNPHSIFLNACTPHAGTQASKLQPLV